VTDRCNGPSCSTKGGVFLDYLSNYQLLKNYSSQWSLLDQIEEDGMGGESSTYGRAENCIQNFSRLN
jgi:hypothetical protein